MTGNASLDGPGDTEDLRGSRGARAPGRSPWVSWVEPAGNVVRLHQPPQGPFLDCLFEGEAP